MKEINEHVLRLRAQSRGNAGKFKQSTYTDKISVQGLWKDEYLLNPPKVSEVPL